MSKAKQPGEAPVRGPDGKFLKGNSGNPKGRRPGAQRRPGLSPQLRRRVVVEISGKRRRLNIIDAVERQLGDQALKGDLGSANGLLRLALMQQANALRAQAQAQSQAEAQAEGERNARRGQGANIRAERRRAAEWEGRAGQFFPIEDPPTEDALLLLDAVSVDGAGALRLRDWVRRAAEARQPGLLARMTAEARETLRVSLEDEAQAAAEAADPDPAAGVDDDDGC